MEDESHGNMPSAHNNNNNHNNHPESASPESPCLKGSNSHKEQDRFLPIANVGRIMKKVIPANGKISKDAKETVQECVSEFISFVTGEASDKCQREKRKTINGDDIIWAITTLGFEDYVVPLKTYLSKYRDIENEKLNVPKQQRSDQQHHQQQHRMLHQQTHHEMHDHNNNSSSSNNNNNNMGGYNINTNVYSSTSYMSQPSFMGTASDHQQFSLPFSPNSIQKQLQQQQQQDQVDSVAQW